MQWYTNRSLNRVGGAKMLDDIDDKAAAFGMADVLYRFGRDGGGTVLRGIINKIEGDGTVDKTGSVNAKTFEAYRRLTANPETRDRVLNAIADRFEKAGEIDRANHHRPSK